MSLRDQILKAPDLKSETVEVPEWSTQVEVREMGGIDRMKWYGATFGPQHTAAEGSYRAHLLVFCLYDGDGNRILEPADAPTLANKSNDVQDRLYAIAARLNGIGKEAEEAAAKNS